MVPGLGRSSGEGKGYPLQYFGLENAKDCIVHRVAKSQTGLRDFHFTSLLDAFSVPGTVPDRWANTIVFLQRKKLKLKEFEWFAHTVRK